MNESFFIAQGCHNCTLEDIRSIPGLSLPLDAIVPPLPEGENQKDLKSLPNVLGRRGEGVSGGRMVPVENLVDRAF